MTYVAAASGAHCEGGHTCSAALSNVDDFGSEEFARDDNVVSRGKVCEVTPQDPPSAALSGGSQETGEMWSGKAWSGGEVLHDDKRSDADTLFDNYLDEIEEVVTLYNDSQVATTAPVCGVVPRGPPTADDDLGSDEFARNGDAASHEQVCEAIPQDPPSTALGGGSQETGGQLRSTRTIRSKEWRGRRQPEDSAKLDCSVNDAVRVSRPSDE